MIGWRIVSVVVAGVATVSLGTVAPELVATDAPSVEAAVSSTVCLRDRSPATLGTLFDTEPAGVVGADYPRALGLPDGRVLWTFQDAAVRTGAGQIEIVHNLVAVQDGPCFSIRYGGTRSSPAPSLFAGRTDPFRRWFWPLDATVGEDGRIYVYAAEMRENGPSYLSRTAPTGTWVAVLDPVDLSVVDELRPPDSSADLYGWSVTSDHDWTYLYAHCYRQFGFDTYIFAQAHDFSCSADVTVARVPRGKLFDPPRYWDGRRWQADPGAAAPIIATSGRLVNANQFEWTGSGFVSVNKEGDWWGDTIYVAHSGSPTGPFRVLYELDAPTKCARIECNSFFSSWLPADAVDASPGRLVFSLSHNRWDGVVSSRYRPTFHTVRAPKLVPAGGTIRVGFPPDVTAAAMTLTSVEATAPGFATVYPCREGRPLASNLNHASEPVVANLVVARPDSAGEVCIYSLAATDLVVDLAGTFMASDGVVALPPSRVADTRDGTGVPVGPVSARSVLEVPVPTTGDGDAVILNVAAVEPEAPGYLTVYPCGRERPGTSNVNVVAEPATSNLVVVEPSVDGRVCIYSHAVTDVVVDRVGALTGGAIGTATRLVDTRLVEDGRISAGAVVEVVVPGDGPTALLNVIAIDPDRPGYLTVYPCDAARPLASNLNHTFVPVVANLVVTAPPGDRRVCVYSHASADVVVDLVGDLGVAVSDPVPSRLVDTRYLTGVAGQFGRP